MREVFYVWRDRKCLARMLISGLLFVLVAAPFKVLFNLIPGVTEVRPANVLPVVFGMVWGPAGAWGTAIANALADIFVSRSPARVWIPGFFINFFFSYLPYKMWYSMGGREARGFSPSLKDVRQIIRYIGICLVDSLVVTAFLGLLFEALGFDSFADSVVLLFFNNFDFAIVLGVPMLLIMANSKGVGVWTPMELAEEGWETDDGGRGGNLFSARMGELLLVLTAAGGLLYFVAGKLHGTTLSSSACCVCLAVIGAVLVFYLISPMEPAGEQAEGVLLSGMSIRAKVILGFLILSVTFILIIGVVAYISLTAEYSDRKGVWQYLYLVVGIALNLLFLVSLIFLKYVEKNITDPLEQLSLMAREFAARDHGKARNSREFIDRFESIRTGDEIEHLSGSFRQMMEDITDYVENLKAATREKERIRAELSVATQIQADMLPRIFPPFPDRPEFDIYASMKPAKEVGGDFYDFFLVDDSHLAVVIGDVSGKGVPAALFMVIAKTLIKNHAQFGSEPADIFTIVNNQLCEGNEAGLFVTAWLGVLNIRSGQLTYVNAGHNPPLLRRRDQSFEYLKVPAGFVLAGLEDIRYTQLSITLSGGDKLFLYTDGVTEAENKEKEPYGVERLREALNGMQEKTAQELVAGVRRSVADFAGEAEQFDDITMLAVTYTGGER